MKRKITISIALVLSIFLVSLMSSDRTAQAQTTATTMPVGFMTLGPNQLLRVTVVNTAGNRNAAVRFGQQSYMQEICNGGVCKHVIASQNISAPVMLMPDEAASFDIPNTGSGVRGAVLSNSPDVQVTAMLINTVTGEVVVAFKVEKGEK